MKADDAARAAAFAESLARGLRQPAEVEAWLDDLVVRTPRPTQAMLDGALAHGDRNRLIRVCHVIGAGASPHDTARHLFADMAIGLERNPACARTITATLEAMASRREWPAPEAEDRMRFFDDALDLAQRRVSGNENVVRRDLLVFLQQYGAAG